MNMPLPISDYHVAALVAVAALGVFGVLIYTLEGAFQSSIPRESTYAGKETYTAPKQKHAGLCVNLGLLFALALLGWFIANLCFTLYDHGTKVHAHDDTPKNVVQTLKRTDNKTILSNGEYGPKDHPFSARQERNAGPFTFIHDGTSDISADEESEKFFPQRKGECQYSGVQLKKSAPVEWLKTCRTSKDMKFKFTLMDKKEMKKEIS